MHTKSRVARSAAAASCALALAAFALGAPAVAKDEGQGGHHEQESAMGHSHEKCEIHGGEVTMTPQHHFETVFTTEGARVWVYDAKQASVLDPKSTKATLTLERKTGEPVQLAMTYVPPDSSKGVVQGFFTAAYDFAAVGKGAMKAVVRIEGLAKAPVEFRTPVVVGEQAVYSCPMHPDVKMFDPGRCSQCGMALEKPHHDEEEMHEAHGHEGHSH